MFDRADFAQVPCSFLVDNIKLPLSVLKSVTIFFLICSFKLLEIMSHPVKSKSKSSQTSKSSRYGTVLYSVVQYNYFM